jgi:polyribonucleotide nucleotidyltransferase
MKKIEKSIDLGGRKLTLSTGKVAQQASGAVWASYGDTVVLATVVSVPQKVDLGYFPLFVDYQERLYAGGRIKGSRWVKREGRPTDEEILTSRLIDRSLRPLFPKNYKNEVQVIVMVLSVDIENDPSILATIASSAAVAISPIPWLGPSATIKIGMKDKDYVVNPLGSEIDSSNMDLIVSSTKEAVIMIEAGAKEVSEKEILGGIEHAKKETDKVIDFINDFAKEVGTKKDAMPKDPDTAKLEKQIEKLITDKIPGIVSGMLEVEGGHSTEMAEFIAAVSDQVAEAEKVYVFGIIDHLIKDYIRAMILKGKRPDGRKLTEIRPLSIEVGVLPRTHGSAIFQRGQTQVLSVATLGAPSLGQLLESAEGEDSKRYMHHYSMPPYASGETGRFGQPSRREIGHGALAERALDLVIPALDKFPYAIRVVSEVTSSNGSTSQAAVCGSTLALMDAGVPITAPVSGIAMGLIIESAKKYAVLSDIMGLEDFNGDMDFKVAGSPKGITAMQLDVKTLNLTPAILKEALEQAKEGRAHILEAMLKVLPEARTKVSAFAPKIKVVKVPVEKIGEVIGPGGKMIKKIVAESGAEVEVEDDGSVNISGTDEAAVDKGVAMVEALVKEVIPGEIYEGTVARIQPFGAFVEILPGKDGLVHVSDMSEGFVKNPEDVVHLGDKVQVRVKEIDNLGRINLSMNMDPSKDKPREERPRGDFGGGRSFGGRREGGYRGGRGGFSRGGGGFSGNNRSDRAGERGGPHFPTSRLLDENKKDYNR